MIFTPTSLEGSFVVEQEAKADERGWFARYFCKNEFETIGHHKEWVQMNHTCTYEKGSVRGMHYQKPPNQEIKLVKCIAGAVLDVIIDLRKDSKTFLQWFGTVISAGNKHMLYIPEGFAHGFQCLEANSELIYLHSAFYVPSAESGIRFDDPLVGIEWPLPVTVVSDRDRQHVLLNENFGGI